MSDQLVSGLITIAVAIVGIAALAVIVSKNAQTSNVVGAASNAFNTSLLAAVSPVTGNSGAGSITFN